MNSRQARKRRQHAVHFKDTYGDLPRKELVRRAQIAMTLGFTVHMKVTCENCATRLIQEEPNCAYESLVCSSCGHDTPFQRGGFLLMTRGMLTEFQVDWLNAPDEIRFPKGWVAA